MSVSRCAYAAAATASAAAPRRALSLQVLASSSSPSAPILDFLLPSFAHRRYGTSSASAGQPRPARQLPQHTPRPWPDSRWPCSSQAPALQGRRCFSSSPKRHNTRTLLNPQMDDDGNEMRLEITPRAAKRLAKVMAKDGNPRLALRIQVESGGCHGFQYLMSLVTLPDQLPPSSEASAPGPDGEPVVRADDTVFSFEGVDDGEAGVPRPRDPLAAPKIILDTPSLELLNGSKVDFTMELIGSQFKITDNPLATSSCGCGTSFDIKA